MSKPGTISITIYPSVANADDLTVVDAMQQVLDTFIVLSRVEHHAAGQTPLHDIIWKLESASTNSPLTIVASAVSSDPTRSVDAQAANMLGMFTSGITDLINSREVPLWAFFDADKTVSRIFERATNGIGRMDIRAGAHPPVIIDHKAAFQAINYLRLKQAEAMTRVEDHTHQERGAVEAEVTGTTTHYKKPAISIRLRLGGKSSRCVLSPLAASKVGPQHSWAEVWSNQRVLITGTIHYDQKGDINLIEAEDIEVLTPTTMTLSDLERKDPITEADMHRFLKDSWESGNG